MNYEPEFNADGTEKHIVCEGARFHVLSYHGVMVNGECTTEVHCSESNCEINRRAAMSAVKGEKG